MRVLHVYKDYDPVLGGIENHIRWLAQSQAAQGHDVTVLVTSLDRHSTVREEVGVRVARAARQAHIASTPLSVQFPMLLRRERPDIAHLHFPYPLGEVSHLLLGRARRTVITYHSDVVRQKTILRLYRPLLRQVLRKADAILPTSPEYLQSSYHLREWRSKCTVVPLGIPLDSFMTNLDDAAKALCREHGRPMLLFVGALRYYKGLQYLIDAMPRIPGARLVVVGDGPMRDEWRQLADRQGVPDQVRFVGRVADQQLPQYYQACDVFILPACSRAEAFGLAAVEAMASGRPVITTELGTGTSFVNVHQKTGLVVPPCQPDALADAISVLLDDASVRLAMGRAARARATSEFRLDLMVQRVWEVYDRVLQQPDQT